MVGHVTNGEVTFHNPNKWLPVSDFRFQMSNDEEPCIAASCFSGSVSYDCQLAPQQAKQQPAGCAMVRAGNRLQQVPPYRGAPLCGTIVGINAAGCLLCIQDDHDAPIELSPKICPLKTLWNTSLLRMRIPDDDEEKLGEETDNDKEAGDEERNGKEEQSDGAFKEDCKHPLTCVNEWRQ